MHRLRRLLAITALVYLLVLVSACTSTRPYVAETFAGWPDTPEPAAAALAYQVFLVGDAGAAASDTNAAALRLLKARLDSASEHSAVVFLGDNLYGGMADSGMARRAEDEARLRRLLGPVEDFAGRVVIIPGEQDWKYGRPGGLEALHHQEDFVEAILDRGNTFRPDDGFPGPVEIELTDRLILVALDTQWWLTPGSRPYGDTDDYEVNEDADFLLQLNDVLRRYDDETLLVVGHHPLVSSGRHGGHLPVKDHLFPLTNLHPSLYLPLPIVGSLYPLYVRFIGGTQDLAAPRYTTLRDALTRIFTLHERLVYVAAHDRNLQYFREDAPEGTHHYVVSGSGAEAQPVLRGGDAGFTYGGEGFAVLNYYDDGALWLDMWAPEPGTDTGRLLFRTELFAPARDLVDPQVPATHSNVPDYTDSTVVMAINPAYEAGSLHEFFLGSHHREAWATPVEAPVLDVGTFAGGLTPLKIGGGQQTTSLRLVNPEGTEYVLRTIDKDPSGTVPPHLQGTIATDLVQDQIASLHPYAAFALPKLARAAGIYHTEPHLVYVPYDPRLGIYADNFAGRLMMIEIRPNNDETDHPNFGHSEDVISEKNLYEEINGDNDHRVDQQAFLRARLFDLLIADWDRHKGQWRWASFEPYELDSTLTGEARTQGKVYRPIPRDRDFAFNKLNGLFPSFARYLDPKFQDFAESYGNLKGLTLNGLHQDRRFLNERTREDFIATAEDLRARLTDEVIDEALRDWPDAIYALDSAEIARILKARRDQLPRIAEQFYRLQARIVDVVGSHKHERFEVTRRDGQTEVVVYKTLKEGEVQKEIYRRTFHSRETKEIRLYGQGGNDQFIIEGKAAHGIRVRAIGGGGEDIFIDDSHMGGFGKKTILYDTQTRTTWDTGPETRIIASDTDPTLNLYDPADVRYNNILPLTYFGANDDDGVFLGGGARFTRYGFRKTPYAARHDVKANFATATQAFNVVYEGHYVSVLGAWDVTLDAEYLSPDNIRNFYGLGNETQNTERDRKYYQARLTQATLAPGLLRRIGSGAGFRIGPSLRFTNVRESNNRFINQPQAGISDNTFDIQWFGSLNTVFDVRTVDDEVNPKQGFRWTSEAALNVGLRNSDDTFSRLASDFAFYLSPTLSPQLTLAARVGAAHNIGDFPFYEASTLGGKDNLRGYRSTRFAGRTSVYQNIELRASLLSFSTYLAIGRLGLLGFFDNGRVWADDDPSTPDGRSRRWHQGYGGGLWTELFDTVVITGLVGFSTDETTLHVKLGFQY